MNLVTISDRQSLSIDLLDYGARITSIRFNELELALTYSKLEDYLSDSFYLGATIGPICNRVNDASMVIEGKRFVLPANEGRNCLHSGGKGFDKQWWSLGAHSRDHAEFLLEFDLASLGLNGNLSCTARYTVANGALTIDYSTRCDQTTFVNLCNHVYLNLSGTSKALDDHVFRLHAGSFLNVNEQKIPTGSATSLPDHFEYRINTKSSVAELDGFCDHHFNTPDSAMMSASSLSSGVSLEVSSSNPGFQFYTGKFLSEPFAESSGFCVETQYPPDAINQNGLESPLLRAGEHLTQSTTFQFKFD